MRELLAMHRNMALCASCHSRMDPLGLGLENFNALGMYRDKEHGHDIDTAGKLITGESFTSIHELKRILKDSRRRDFYNCLTEKFLTYALGRGPEYYDAEAIDRIAEQLERDEGRFSTLLMGVIESAPFQKRRNGAADASLPQPKPAPKTKKVSLLPPTWTTIESLAGMNGASWGMRVTWSACEDFMPFALFRQRLSAVPVDSNLH
jgi:Protein of unknown function (DUF1585)/Protein of unknown function (DUF1588)